MIIAIPLTEDDAFSPHYGASAKLGLFEVDRESRTICSMRTDRPSEPEPCSWADWLAAQKVAVFITSGIGRGAQQRLTDAGIAVFTGVLPAEPRALVQGWLDGTAATGHNPCEQDQHDHGHHAEHGHAHAHAHPAGGCGCSHG